MRARSSRPRASWSSARPRTARRRFARPPSSRRSSCSSMCSSRTSTASRSPRASRTAAEGPPSSSSRAGTAPTSARSSSAAGHEGSFPRPSCRGRLSCRCSNEPPGQAPPSGRLGSDGACGRHGLARRRARQPPPATERRRARRRPDRRLVIRRNRPDRVGAAPREQHGPAAPRGELHLVPDRPGLGRALDTATNVAAATLIAVVVGLLVVRYRASTPVARRVFRPIGLTGAVALALLAAGFAAGPIDQRVKDVLVTISLIALTTVPFWFLAGLLRSRLARGGVAQLLLDVRETASLEEAQDGLRRALNDHGVMLAAWVEERHGYVDPDGRAFEVPEEDVDRIATMVASETGEPVAVIVHDRALLDEPELLEAVAIAARLALHPNPLPAELPAPPRQLPRARELMRALVDAAPA